MCKPGMWANMAPDTKANINKREENITVMHTFCGRKSKQKKL